MLRKLTRLIYIFIMILILPGTLLADLPPAEQIKAFIINNQPEKALQLAVQVIDSGHESLEIYQLQAEAYFLIGQVDESLKSLAALEKLYTSLKNDYDKTP